VQLRCRAAADSQDRLNFSCKLFGLMFEVLDVLHPNEVYIASGGSFRDALGAKREERRQ
jgi:hypothetical protein